MIWHVAFAVDNLEEAMDEFGRAMQLEWNPIKNFTGASTYPDGTEYELSTRLTFATAGPCALELFERVPGTPNEPRQGTVFHHLGYWTDDVAAEHGRLEPCGWNFAGGPVAGRAGFFTSTLGVVIEACNVNIDRPGLEKYYPAAENQIGRPDLLV